MHVSRDILGDLHDKMIISVKIERHLSHHFDDQDKKTSPNGLNYATGTEALCFSDSKNSFRAFSHFYLPFPLNLLWLLFQRILSNTLDCAAKLEFQCPTNKMLNVDATQTDCCNNVRIRQGENMFLQIAIPPSFSSIFLNTFRKFLRSPGS